MNATNATNATNAMNAINTMNKSLAVATRRCAALLLPALLSAWLFWCAPLAQAGAVEEAIRAGGVALLIRHATAPGTGDPEYFKLNDCSTQRNLSESGRDEARRLGLHLKNAGLKPGAVLTSQWCRCRETAQLAFGGAQDWPALNSFFRQRDSEAKQRSEVAARIARIKPGDAPLVLVTHQVVITSVSGVFAESGEVVVVAPAGKQIKVVGTIKAAAMP